MPTILLYLGGLLVSCISFLQLKVFTFLCQVSGVFVGVGANPSPLLPPFAILASVVFHFDSSNIQFVIFNPLSFSLHFNSTKPALFAIAKCIF